MLENMLTQEAQAPSLRNFIRFFPFIFVTVILLAHYKMLINFIHGAGGKFPPWGFQGGPLRRLDHTLPLEHWSFIILLIITFVVGYHATLFQQS